MEHQEKFFTVDEISYYLQVLQNSVVQKLLPERHHVRLLIPLVFVFAVVPRGLGPRPALEHLDHAEEDAAENAESRNDEDHGHAGPDSAGIVVHRCSL